VEAVPVIELDHVTKIYPLKAGDVVALDDVTLRISKGEFIAIMGPSGSGKSTLLNQIGCLDVPTRGDLYISGSNIRKMTDQDLTTLRLGTIGFVFQKFNLIPVLTAFENVEYPYLMKNRREDTTGRVRNLLNSVGIDDAMARHRPTELSGGQQQRVSIARALVNDPAILLCDEPTGNLDSKTGDQIMELLAELHRQGRTIITVTHDARVSQFADRIVSLTDGRVN
jgi:putative ABC transport system ATP-binding protein